MRIQAKQRTREASVLPKATGSLLLVLLLFASIGQALHTHLQPTAFAGWASGAVWQAAAADNGTADDSAETCPLCVAMHSARPASAATSLGGVLAVTGKVAERLEVFRDERIAFARRSRAPPIR